MTKKAIKFITLRITPQLFEAIQRAAAAKQWQTGQRCSVNVLAVKYIEDGLQIDEHYLSRNEQREGPLKSARPEWVLTADIKPHLTTLRVDPDLHKVIAKMTAGLHLATGTPISINTGDRFGKLGARLSGDFYHLRFGGDVVWRCHVEDVRGLYTPRSGSVPA